MGHFNMWAYVGVPAMIWVYIYMIKHMIPFPWYQTSPTARGNAGKTSTLVFTMRGVFLRTLRPLTEIATWRYESSEVESF